MMNDDPAYNDWCECVQSLTEARDRMRHLLNQIAIRRGPCRGCRAPLVFVQHANGKLTPYDADGDNLGSNHFAVCKERDRFRKEKHAATKSE